MTGDRRQVGENSHLDRVLKQSPLSLLCCFEAPDDFISCRSWQMPEGGDEEDREKEVKPSELGSN